MHNRVLAALPELDRQRLVRQLRPVSIAAGTKLLTHERLGFCLFLEEGIASIQSEPSGGLPVCVSIVGFDGMVGLSAVLEGDRIPYAAFALTACKAFAIDPAQLRMAIRTSPSLNETLLRYVYRRLTGLIRVAGCCLRHPVEHRLASCLLTATTLLRTGSIRLTHHQLAAMLGVTRPSVTLALNRLEAQEGVFAGRNLVAIRNRDILRRISCGCYGEDAHADSREDTPFGHVPLVLHRAPSPAGSPDRHPPLDGPAAQTADAGGTETSSAATN